MTEVKMTQIIPLLSEGKIAWTEHVVIRLRERGIKRVDLLKCIYNGEIIKQYMDDTPYPSCLILGYDNDDNPLHVVIGLNVDILLSIITVYQPDLSKWENDYKTRKDR